MAVKIVMSDEEARKIARGFLDHQKEIEDREAFELSERISKREAENFVTLSTGKKINLEKLNCLMSTTGNELDELCLILKTKRLGRELKQIRIDNDLLDEDEEKVFKPKYDPIPPIHFGHVDYQEGN
jgi:hypothetical protein